MLSQPQCFLHISANLGQARLKRLVTVVFAFAAGLIAPVMLVAALCQGRDADVKMNTKQWGATSIRWGGFISITRERLRSVTALILAEPVLASQQVQGGVQVHVNLVNAVPDGLQGGPPVGGLGLLLAPPSGGQEEDQEDGEQGHPRSARPRPAHPTETSARLL